MRKGRWADVPGIVNVFDQWRKINKGSGLAIVLILITAMIVSVFAVKNMTALNNFPAAGVEQNNDPVQQAQDVLDLLNDSIKKRFATILRKF